MLYALSALQEVSDVYYIIFLLQVFSDDYTFKEPYPPSSNGEESGDGSAGVRVAYMVVCVCVFGRSMYICQISLH